MKDKDPDDEKLQATLQTTLAKKEEELVMKRKELKPTTKDEEEYMMCIKVYDMRCGGGAVAIECEEIKIPKTSR